MASTKGHSRTFLFLQTMSTLLFLGIYAISFYLSYQKLGYIKIENILSLAPAVILLILTLIAATVLRLKHRSFAAEGEVLPFLMFLISMEGVNFLPECFEMSGILFLPPTAIAILGRFTYIGVAVLFVYCALLYMGLSISKLTYNLTIALFLVLIVSILIPINTNLITSVGNSYNINFFLAIVIINLVAIFSYFLASINDRVNHDIKRAFTFLFLIIGNTLLISIFSTYVTKIIGAILYLIGTIMLLVSHNENFG